jgi:hypothetical protein
MSSAIGSWIALVSWMNFYSALARLQRVPWLSLGSDKPLRGGKKITMLAPGLPSNFGVIEMSNTSIKMELWNQSLL